MPFCYPCESKVFSRKSSKIAQTSINESSNEKSNESSHRNVSCWLRNPTYQISCSICDKNQVKLFMWKKLKIYRTGLEAKKKKNIMFSRKVTKHKDIDMKPDDFQF